MCADFYFTNTLSQGNSALEGNIIGRTWWELMGRFRFIEIPLYAVGIVGTAYIINFKNKFFPLLWLNLLAFNHLFGAASWISGVNLSFIYSLVRYDWVTPYAISLVSTFISLPLTLLQFYFKKLLLLLRGAAIFARR